MISVSINFHRHSKGFEGGKWGGGNLVVGAFDTPSALTFLLCLPIPYGQTFFIHIHCVIVILGMYFSILKVLFRIRFAMRTQAGAMA